MHLTPKQETVLRLVFLEKINTLSVVILWLPVIKNFVTPYFSFHKFWPAQYIWDPLPKKMIAPLMWLRLQVHVAVKDHLRSCFKIDWKCTGWRILQSTVLLSVAFTILWHSPPPFISVKNNCQSRVKPNVKVCWYYIDFWVF